MLVLAERVSGYWQAESALSRLHGYPQADCLVIADGHAALDGRIFCAEHVRGGRMSVAQVRAYKAAVAQAAPLLPAWAAAPVAYIYLQATPTVCRARAARRDRAEEHTLDLDFFARMCAACDGVADDMRARGDAFYAVHANEPLDRVLENVRTIVQYLYDSYKV